MANTAKIKQLTNIQKTESIYPVTVAQATYRADGVKTVEESLIHLENAGIQGPEGKSAYQIAVANGYKGTESQWLASLKGQKGDSGLQGPEGPEGKRGPAGADGKNGEAGKQGPKGEPGMGFKIYKTYPSIAEMNNSFASSSNIPEGGFVIISTDISNEENAKLYVKSKTQFDYITDLSGAQGIQGPAGAAGQDGSNGAPGAAGKDGANGQDGIGIQSVKQTTTSTADNGNNIITVTLTNGVTSTFTIQNGSKGSTGAAGQNGINGQDGKNGISPHIGENGNWFIGKDDTQVKAQGPQGSTGAAGQNGTNGQDGANGQDGIGIESVKQTTTSTADNGNNVITVKLTNGNTSTFTIQNGSKGSTGAAGQNGINGAPGAAGKDGAEGKSAYQVAVANGYLGTESQWLTSLKGTDGQNGSPGASVGSMYCDNPVPGTAGQTDTWTMYDTNSSMLGSFKVHNGSNGINGNANVTVSTSDPPSTLNYGDLYIVI